ncbi:uncharacterized protein LOC143277598 [Babylonia areolata]|uniref:uncharacterized protein LOC143277598 n=1 Tax=Babylonia areolata TaxID=304850 RepID=UPI003FD09EF7
MAVETWLRPDILSSELFPPNYDVYRWEREDSYDGVLVATKNTLITHQLPSDPSAEAVLVSVHTQIKNSKLIIGSVYRTPSATSEEYTTATNRVIEQACHSQRSVVWLGGDFNLPDIDWKTSNIISHQNPKTMNQAYINKLQDTGLLQINHSPTRGENILDLFITNRPSLVSRCTTLPGLSDHDILLCDSTIQPTRTKPIPCTVHVWAKAEKQKMKQDIAALTEQLLCTGPVKTTVHEMWDKIHSALTKTLNDHVPKKTCSTKVHQPWFNNTFKRLSRRKSRAWKKAKTTQKDHDWQRFEHLQRETRKACHTAHSTYISALITEEGDAIRLWQYVKSKKCDTTGVAPLKKAGVTYSDPSVKANILNEQFCSVFTEEDLRPILEIGESLHPDMPNIIISEEGVLKLLRNLNP